MTDVSETCAEVINLVPRISNLDFCERSLEQGWEVKENLILNMTSAQAVETSVTENKSASLDSR